MTDLLRIGVDVGGTNTDAALLSGLDVLATTKRSTSENLVDGVVACVADVLDQAQIEGGQVDAVMIGTTHFLNAIVQRKDLQRVGVLRLCGPATRSIPPMIDWPEDLRDCVLADIAMVNGGMEVDGRPIAPIDTTEIETVCKDWSKAGVTAVAICSVFSPMSPEMEEAAAAIVAKHLPAATVCLSHKIGQSGLLKRESATILNASLGELSAETVAAFRDAFAQLSLTCPLYLTQNDGTVMAADYAQAFPIFTVASGTTNSMRGAAFLTGLQDAVVIDVGGTTTDVGVLAGGFPRRRGDGALIAGVPTNFRVPDVFSYGLGGGSLVRKDGAGWAVGPSSVGHQLTEKALVFGGDTLTTTDVAVVAGQSDLGDGKLVAGLTLADARAILHLIQTDLEDVIDRMKPSADPIPAVLVGGGSMLFPQTLAGTRSVVRPDHYGSANAIGAAIAQVSGEVDSIVSLTDTNRDTVLETAIETAKERARMAGAAHGSLDVVEISETPLAYVPGNACRVAVKVVGELAL